MSGAKQSVLSISERVKWPNKDAFQVVRSGGKGVGTIWHFKEGSRYFDDSLGLQEYTAQDLLAIAKWLSQ